MVTSDRLARRAAIVVLGAALVAGHADAAGMQTDTATTAVTIANPASRPVQNRDVDNPVRNYYEAFTGAPNCAAAGACLLYFPAMPKTVTEIKHVACQLNVPTGGTIVSAFLGYTNYQPFNTLQTFASGVALGATEYGINTDVSLFYTEGQQPFVQLYSVGEPIMAFYCTLTGTTVL